VVADERRAASPHVAVGRLELLYPFPSPETERLLGSYPNLKEIVWLQEEPANMGARKWVVPQVAEIAPMGVGMRHVCRPERSSPAEGYPAAHKTEQQHLVDEVLA
jgi:2-oxoglutarate dehydrogenase E1 component